VQRAATGRWRAHKLVQSRDPQHTTAALDAESPTLLTHRNTAKTFRPRKNTPVGAKVRDRSVKSGTCTATILVLSLLCSANPPLLR
jgi:ribosomal protein L5